jgi:hypothetical protein
MFISISTLYGYNVRLLSYGLEFDLGVDILDEDSPVSVLPVRLDLSTLHVGDGLSGLLHGPDLDPRLDLVLHGEIQHLQNLAPRSDMARSDESSVPCHGLGSEGRPLVLGHTDKDKVSTDGEGGDEFVQGEGRGGGSADDDVELLLEFLLESFGSDDELVSTHGQSVILLPLRVGEYLSSDSNELRSSTNEKTISSTHGDLGTQSLSEQNSVMTQSSQTDNSDLAALSNVVTEQRTTRGDSCTQPVPVSVLAHRPSNLS